MDDNVAASFQHGTDQVGQFQIILGRQNAGALLGGLVQLTGIHQMNFLIFTDDNSNGKIDGFVRTVQGGKFEKQHLAATGFPLAVRPVARKRQSHQPCDLITVNTRRWRIPPATTGSQDRRDGHRMRQAGGAETRL